MRVAASVRPFQSQASVLRASYASGRGRRDVNHPVEISIGVVPVLETLPLAIVAVPELFAVGVLASAAMEE